MTASAPSSLTTNPLVDAIWLRDRLDTVAVLDTRGPHEYLAGHLPGARSLPVGGATVTDTRRTSLVELATAIQVLLGERGISADRPVVLVDDNDGSACYALTLLELAGLTEVRVLAGGIVAWLELGEPLEQDPIVGNATSLDLVPSFTNVATIDDVREAAAVLTDVVLVDARSQLEHLGVVGAPCCAYRGAIPRSRHLEWATLLSATGTLHEPERIRAEAEAAGLGLHDDIVIYCHTGHRSAVAALALRSAGFTRVRNWLGSWHEWAARGLPRGEE